MPYGADLRRRRGGRGDGWTTSSAWRARPRSRPFGLVLLLASWTGVKRPDGRW